MILSDIMDFYNSVIKCCTNKNEKFDIFLYRDHNQFVIDIVNATTYKQVALLEINLIDEEIRYLINTIRNNFINSNSINMSVHKKTNRAIKGLVHQIQNANFVLNVDINSSLEAYDSNKAHDEALKKIGAKQGSVLKHGESTSIIDDVITSYMYCVNVLKNKEDKFIIYLYRNKENFAVQIMEKETKRVVYFEENKLSDENILILTNFIRNNFIHTHYIYVPALETSASSKMGYAHALHNTVYDLIIDINTQDEMFHARIAQDSALMAHSIETSKKIKKYYKI